MSWLGTGVPVISYNNTAYELPKPIKGGRIERYIPETKSYKNTDGNIVTGENKWRFSGEYHFEQVDSDVIDTIINIYNEMRNIRWIPHGDASYINYLVRIIDLIPDSTNGIITANKLTIKVLGSENIYKIWTQDNAIALFEFDSIAVKR